MALSHLLFQVSNGDQDRIPDKCYEVEVAASIILAATQEILAPGSFTRLFHVGCLSGRERNAIEKHRYNYISHPFEIFASTILRRINVDAQMAQAYGAAWPSFTTTLQRNLLGINRSNKVAVATTTSPNRATRGSPECYALRASR